MLFVMCSMGQIYMLENCQNSQIFQDSLNFSIGHVYSVYFSFIPFLSYDPVIFFTFLPFGVMQIFTLLHSLSGKAWLTCYNATSVSSDNIFSESPFSRAQISVSFSTHSNSVPLQYCIEIRCWFDIVECHNHCLTFNQQSSISNTPEARLKWCIIILRLGGISGILPYSVSGRCSLGHAEYVLSKIFPLSNPSAVGILSNFGCNLLTIHWSRAISRSNLLHLQCTFGAPNFKIWNPCVFLDSCSAI